MTDKACALKERTLAVEVKHAELTGGTFRDAETANIRNLERLAARQRDRKPAAQKPKPRGQATTKQVDGTTVTVRQAPKQKLMSPPCKFCGRCTWCKRFQRTQVIMRKGREGDVDMLKLSYDLVGIALAAQGRSDFKDALGREYPFSRIKGHTATRALNAGVEAVCDRSAAKLGPWR